jgi:integrase
VYRRRAGEPRPVRVKLGNYPLLTLEKAREKAKQTLGDLAAGRDTKEREQKELRVEARRRQDTFGSVAGDFIERHVAKLRSSKAMEATIRRELLGQKLKDGKWAIDPDKETHWRERPITEIKRRDVIELLEEIVDRGTRHQARKVLAYVRKLFNWSIARDAYALEGSPCDRVRPKDIVGKLKPRQRVLSDEELRLVWRASFKLGTTEDSQVEAKFPDYPFGPFVRMLIITGQRLREVSDAGKPEIDGALWTIPPERMKGDAGHEVPLSPMARDLLKSLPSFKGEFIFTTTSGKRPISGFSKTKARLDRIIAELQKKMPKARRSHRCSGGPTTICAGPSERACPPWECRTSSASSSSHIAAQNSTRPTTGTNTATRSETLLIGGRYAYGPSLSRHARTLYRCAARNKRARRYDGLGGANSDRVRTGNRGGNKGREVSRDAWPPNAPWTSAMRKRRRSDRISP